MKLFHYTIIRALCAIAVGALLVKYRDEAVEVMTQVIGGLFVLFGLISFIKPKALRKKNDELADDATDAAAKADNTLADSLQGGARGCAALGSLLLGAVLICMPTTFVHFLVYVLSAFLIIGAIQQFVTLGAARSNASVGLFYWVMPTLLFITGVVALFKPSVIASAPLFFIGWCMMIYGVIECVNSLKARSNKKKAEKEFYNLNHKPDFSEAEEVEAEYIAPDNATKDDDA